MLKQILTVDYALDAKKNKVAALVGEKKQLFSPLCDLDFLYVLFYW